MTTYGYRCDRDGELEIRCRLGTAPPSVICPTCGRQARRAYTRPMLSRAPRPLVAVIDHAEKTRHEPDVVTALPPARPGGRTPVLELTPKLRRLPRP